MTQISLFLELLTEANKQVNLVSPRELPFLEAHIDDSLLLSPYVQKNIEVIDLGSGGGFPVIPLAITHPGSSFTAIDSSERKCDFLLYASQKLTLKNLSIIHGRIEDQTQLHNSFQLVTARALAPLQELLSLSAPFLNKNPEACLAFLKGENATTELSKAENALQRLSLQVRETEQITNLKGRKCTTIIVFQYSSIL